MRLLLLSILAFIIGGFNGAEIDPGLYQGTISGGGSNRMEILLSLNLDGTFNLKRTLSSGTEIVTNGDWSVNEDTLELAPIDYKSKSPKLKHECPTSDSELKNNCETTFLYISDNRIYTLKSEDKYTSALSRKEKYEVPKKGYSK